MNEVRLTGRVLNCYIHDKGAFICKIAVKHEHYIGNYTTTEESVFNTVMQNERKIKTLDVKKGDTVLLTGYLKLDHNISAGGNDHQTTRIYATDIEVTKPKKSFDMVDYAKQCLGL